MSSQLHDQITRDYYATTAARGHTSERAHYEQTAEQLLRRVAPWMPPDRDARCLDLACGCGELLYLLEREGFRHTVGVDLCQEELDRGRPFVRAELIHSEVLDYLKSCPPQSVDWITALNILEHLPKDSLLSVLVQTRRILRPGGTLVAMVPNAVSPFGSLTRHWDLTHEWAFTPNNFRQLASLTGFSPHVDFRECGPVAHGLKSTVRYLLWQLLRAGIAGWLLVELATTKGGVYTQDMLVRLHAPVSS
jgi:SAM-dependent methyltransferase